LYDLFITLPFSNEMKIVTLNTKSMLTRDDLKYEGFCQLNFFNQHLDFIRCYLLYYIIYIKFVFED